VKVTAVVVTFNRSRLVAECLDALLAQTVPVSTIVLVDNASTDGTAEFLRSSGRLSAPGVRLERLTVNGGGAGGFARGVAVGRETDCDWLWLMDDDATPQPETLATLLDSRAATDPRSVCVCPAVQSPDGKLQVTHRGHFHHRPRPLSRAAYVSCEPVALDFTSFVGPLIRAEVARRIEPPLARFFIWCEDYEYCFRLREHGDIILEPASVIVHRDVGQRHTNRRSRFWNRLVRPLLGWDLVPARLETFWRNLCGLRNLVWLRRRYEGDSALRSTAVIAQFILRSLMCDEQPLRRIPWIIRYGVSGRRGIFTNIAPDQWVARARRGEV